jgi:hypothetical protein
MYSVFETSVSVSHHHSDVVHYVIKSYYVLFPACNGNQYGHHMEISLNNEDTFSNML